MMIGGRWKGILTATLIVVSLCCCDTNGGQQGSSLHRQTQLTDVFRFHRRLEVSDRMRIDVLSWGAASIGGYLLLSSDDSANVYSSVSGDRYGAIVECWLTDLDRDESSEVILAMQSAGSGSYGSLIIYEFGLEGKSRQMRFPELPEELSVGYMGHDSFQVKSDRIIRTFPVYHPGDPNAAPSGGIREIEYMIKNDAVQVLGSREGERKQE